MKEIRELLEKNRDWAGKVIRRDPDFFSRLVRQQKPEYLWIGCSDSRVPANEIVDLLPGELFVHRNIANLVVHSDMNCLSVLQYAVEFLRVKHIIVCGHYGCGGVHASTEEINHGLVDNWLCHIRDLYQREKPALETIADETDRLNRLCELNVMAQVENVANTTILRDAWKRGQSITVHGWIYDLADGLINDLGVSVNKARGEPA